MNIVLISGSASPNSRTLALMQYIQSVLVDRGVKVTLWDLQKKPLPIVDPRFHENPIENPDTRVQELNRLVGSADGVILGTPVYHGSYTGLLKNALDNLRGDILRGKFVGLVSNAGGVGNTVALEHMRSVVRTLYGYALQTQIATTEDDYEIYGEKVLLSNTNIQNRCVRLVEELLMMMQAIYLMNSKMIKTI